MIFNTDRLLKVSYKAPAFLGESYFHDLHEDPMKCMISAHRCYQLGLDVSCGKSGPKKSMADLDISLRMRLGKFCNEIVNVYMDNAVRILNGGVDCESELLVTLRYTSVCWLINNVTFVAAGGSLSAGAESSPPAEAPVAESPSAEAPSTEEVSAVKNSCRLSRARGWLEKCAPYLEEGVSVFKCIGDKGNTAALLATCGKWKYIEAQASVEADNSEFNPTERSLYQQVISRCILQYSYYMCLECIVL